ncbi:DUF427 domain-containing protein [Halanaerobacter jeridensis]|uniref:Uncharacterized protein (DUF427 family) n=1 Tax=Halanaerobacter jeridensis TaxID=706427 RepID=A0A938XV51_9FIRM|nr:DUF427 domain-containing protein [Halanaerobacter jeridensis]MBM7557419.1 uncharacterized protein (DUF427 family) [Halanaerobacter jeridensis]
MTEQAIWRGLIVAESSDCIVVEGNHYFPPGDVKKEYLVSSDKETICPWKGRAEYYNLVAQRTSVENVAWSYPEPKDKAQQIKEYIAFADQIKVEEK